MQYKLANTEQDILNCYPVMSQLRKQLTQSEFKDNVTVQSDSGYKLLMAEDEGRVVGVAGFIIGHKLAWGKHLYIDDLVALEGKRSLGVGRQLLVWLDIYARENSCKSIHLDSGVQRFSAHKFYFREGFNIASHHFSKSL